VKILHTVEFYTPSVGGMQEVVRQLSERLVRMGHDVAVATSFLPGRKDGPINGVKIIPFRIRGNLVKGLSGEVDSYREYLLRSDFDVVINFAAQQWATDAALEMLDKIGAKKIFVPTGFSRLHSPEYKAYYDSMKTWMKQYDMNVFQSERYQDVRFARESGVTRIVLIPNGAGRDEFSRRTNLDVRNRLGISRNHFLILHVGSHTGTKGHGRAIEIFKRAEIRDATFLIVANRSEGGCFQRCRREALTYRLSPNRLLRRKQLIVAELSREETVEAYHEADLFLFPSAVECSPLVLFECMASRTPYLTTDAGNAEEIIEWSKGGMLLPRLPAGPRGAQVDVRGSAELLEWMTRHPEKREAMASSGYTAWEKRFTWETIVLQYENLYSKLAGEIR
jgi:glycosyltransferase involved in cell wall biosynthesis